MYCGRTAADTVLEVDHVVPRVAGGTSRSDNLATACRDCNGAKSGDLIPLPRHLEPVGLVERWPVQMLRTAGSPTIHVRWCDDRCPACGIATLPRIVDDADGRHIVFGYRCRADGTQWLSRWDTGLARLHSSSVRRSEQERAA